jgi:hypothetical protein
MIVTAAISSVSPAKKKLNTARTFKYLDVLLFIFHQPKAFFTVVSPVLILYPIWTQRRLSAKRRRDNAGSRKKRRLRIESLQDTKNDDVDPRKKIQIPR